ncbi:tumor protein p53-inducible nuclear protein 1 [Pholidichthys leucotaenia]
MFRRITSAIFGDVVEEVSQDTRPGDDNAQEEVEEDWILVKHLTESSSGQSGDCSEKEQVGKKEEKEQDDDDEEEYEDLVMIPAPTPSPPVRYPSNTSLNSMPDSDQEGGAKKEEEEEDDENGFLHVNALQESWLITPPPCFTGTRAQPQPILPENPLENLLIEHPSMSVYNHFRSPQLPVSALPQHTSEEELDSFSDEWLSSPTDSPEKENTNHTPDPPRHRPEAAVAQRRSNPHSRCYAAALPSKSGLLKKRPSKKANQRAKPLTRKALRRLNPLRSTKVNTRHLNQPTKRHLNF